MTFLLPPGIKGLRAYSFCHTLLLIASVNNNILPMNYLAQVNLVQLEKYFPHFSYFAVRSPLRFAENIFETKCTYF